MPLLNSSPPNPRCCHRRCGSGAQTLHPRRIASIHTGSVATQDGTLKIGDVIVTVNGDVTTEHGGYMITLSTK